MGIDAIDLTNDDSDDEHSDEPIPVHPPASTSTAVNGQPGAASSGSVRREVLSTRKPPNTQQSKGPIVVPTKPTRAEAKAPTDWSCPTCTLVNPISSLTCEACTSPRPAIRGDGQSWYCEFCGAGPREMGFWSCVECGWVRKWG